jgi:hypothetical protein
MTATCPGVPQHVSVVLLLLLLLCCFAAVLVQVWVRLSRWVPQQQ